MNSCKTLVNFFNLLECFHFQLHKKMKDNQHTNEYA